MERRSKNMSFHRINIPILIAGSVVRFSSARCSSTFATVLSVTMKKSVEERKVSINCHGSFLFIELYTEMNKEVIFCSYGLHSAYVSG